ncbi:PepSY domain-containing protein [Segetibacter sp. 3557_3]|uniref:PepSY-associated TM helix domain-containing protein n=1 Tax=Segetibacter sp. 3557_3 TaxID=2547429 RepID=UPI0010588C3C|nr:PepSY-associated TM helix domain-containing protein [Segetibacter sp. 3557_3]TDH24243.1 PepSY domain-containing protein [Segetibacter sp. 3557_3]
MIKFSFRKLAVDIHLWLGLASGLVLFVVCLSGTVYTFRAEIERLLSPSKFYVSVPAGSTRLSPDTLIARVQGNLQGTVVSLSMPSDPERSYQFGVRVKEDKKAVRPNAGSAKRENESAKAAASPGAKPGAPKEAGAPRPKNYFVDPYTGKIVGEDGGSTSKFFTTTMQLHRWLLMDTGVGRVIVGTATLIFLAIIITGLVIWFPSRLKNWKQGFKVKFRGNWKRVNHDLHNTLGFYSSFLLLVMTLTGLCWSFEWYKDGASKVLGAKVFGGRNEKPLQSSATVGTPVALTTVLQAADQIFPYQGDYRVNLAADSGAVVTVLKNRTGFFALSAADRVMFDQYTGTPLKTERFADKPLNEQIAGSIKPLHTGEIFGTFSKILYFLACLIATSLPVTGTIIWLNKLKKKRKRAGKPSTREVQTYEAEIELR